MDGMNIPKAVPALGRNHESGFDPNEMNLTWQMLNASS